jgi:hypothetical protein
MAQPCTSSVVAYRLEFDVANCQRRQKKLAEKFGKKKVGFFEKKVSAGLVIKYNTEER